MTAGEERPRRARGGSARLVVVLVIQAIRSLGRHKGRTVLSAIFGYLPARRAPRLDPIEALRSD